MKRLPRGWGGPSATRLCLLLSLALSASVLAQQRPGDNPLRVAPKVESAAASSAVPTSAAGAVGTSVRPANPSFSPPTSAPRAAPIPRAAAAHRGHGRVVPAGYRQRVARPVHPASSPFHDFSETSVLQGTVTVNGQPGEIIDGGILGGEYTEGFVTDSGHGGCDGCGQCNECSIPCPRIPFDDLTVSGGVQGFTGPMNRGTGSFGFHEGFNWGLPVPCFSDCLSMQLGARFAQSNLSGAEFTPDNRGQVFLTGGLFRRVDCGFQGGVAFDYLSDDWYASTDLYQLRAEIAWVFPCAHELGFWLTASTNEYATTSRVFSSPAMSVNINETWEATDLYAFYYRHRFAQWEGTTARVYAGFTGANDGLLGADIRVPLNGDFALEAGFTYLVPEEDKGPVGAGNEQESWNVAVGLVWYPCSGRAMARSYNSPLFNVADNGSFMVDRVR